MEPLDLRGELLIDGKWVDATGSILKRQSLLHSRGRQDQGARVDPSTCAPLLNNTNGQFSPDNPMGPYYGKFGRNTPFRVSIAAGSTFLATTGTTDRAETPDHASLDITGDIDVRLEAHVTDWHTSTPTELAGKFTASTGGRSWLLFIYQGRLFFYWSTDGTNEFTSSSNTQVTIPPSGRMAVRVTMDVDNGAGGRTITYYTAPSIAGPWTQLGNPIVQTGTTSIANTAQPVQVGAVGAVAFADPVARFYKFELRNGIGGSLVAAPDFTAQTPGATSFVDSEGRTWSLSGNASLSNRHTRLMHELAAYPTRWHPSGKHAWVEAQTAGILRRLRRSSTALESTLRRRIPSGNPLAYWPMEEGANASQFYSPIPRVRPLRTSGMNLAADDSLAGSSALPTLRGGAFLSGSVPPVLGTTEWHCEFVFRAEQGPTTPRTVLQWTGTGRVKRWRLMLYTDGAEIYGYDDDDATVTGHVAVLNGLGVWGAWTRWKIFARQNGANVNYTIAWVPIGGTGGSISGSYSGSVGRITGVKGPDGGYSGDLDGLALGHLGVFTTADTLIYNDADIAFTGETAGKRMQRLAAEEGLPVTVRGVVAEQERVGPQRPNDVLELLEEAADADGGILYEARDQLALRYRDRAGMYNQRPALVLDYTQPGLAPPLEPTGDDDATQNDVTVTRADGSSGRAVLEEGALSVQAPPAGVGPYPAQVTLNLHEDAQAEPIAYWLMHLGTYEGRRYPQVRVMVHKAPPELLEQILTVDIGDKLVIKNPPVWVAPGDVELIVQGYEETWASQFEWDIVFNCTPGAPWNVGVVTDPALAWADTDGSALATAATATASTVDVVTTVGNVWTSNGSDYPWDLRAGGEVMTVVGPGRLATPNPFFEVDASGWTPENATREHSAEVVHPQAEGSLKIIPNGTSATGGAMSDLTAVDSITPGAQYVVRMWVYSPTGHADLRPMARWYTNAGAFVSTTSVAQAAVPAGRWTYQETVVTAPSTAGRVRVQARYGGTPTQPFYVWAVLATQPSASMAYDSFTRTTASTWGVSSSGHAWAESGGAASDRSIGGTVGSLTLASAPDTPRFQRITPATVGDCEVLVRMRVSQVATGASIVPSVLLRYTDSSNFYRARVHFGTGGGMFASIARDFTAVGSTPALPYTYAANDWFWVRARVTGHRVQMRVWPMAAPEPTVWHHEATITTNPIPVGAIGVTGSSFAGNTNASLVIGYDDFEIVNPQTFSVLRSRNGIVKAQSVGEDVRLAYPTIVAL